jgi:hypothetical protein
VSPPGMDRGPSRETEPPPNQCLTAPPSTIDHSVRPSTEPSPQRRVDVAAFRRFAVAVAVADQWTPWAEFVDSVHGYLAPQREARDTLAGWRHVRDRVLEELASLGLTGVVVRSDGEQPAIGEHEADIAGLVRVYVDGPQRRPEPVPMPASLWHSRDRRNRHALQMLATHNLILADDRIPSRLRAFCGQSALSNHETPPDWQDHVHTWTDNDGDPVLTVEPYYRTEDPTRLVAEITRELADGELPLVVEGPHPGVWSAATVLVLLRYDLQAAPLPAEHWVWRAWPGTVGDGPLSRAARSARSRNVRLAGRWERV